MMGVDYQCSEAVKSPSNYRQITRSVFLSSIKHMV